MNSEQWLRRVLLTYAWDVDHKLIKISNKRESCSVFSKSIVLCSMASICMLGDRKTILPSPQPEDFSVSAHFYSISQEQNRVWSATMADILNRVAEWDKAWQQHILCRPSIWWQDWTKPLHPSCFVVRTMTSGAAGMRFNQRQWLQSYRQWHDFQFVAELNEPSADVDLIVNSKRCQVPRMLVQCQKAWSNMNTTVVPTFGPTIGSRTCDSSKATIVTSVPQYDDLGWDKYCKAIGEFER